MPVGIVHRDAATAEFFDGTARGELLIRRCRACGAHSAPQARTCPRCASPELSWTAAAGTGLVVSWSVVHVKGGPPFVVGIVELDEEPWVQAQIVEVAPEDVYGGMRVRVAFERPEGGESVPVFHPAP
ncbi:Zn-ribbon domain-containing OB-fold protein [Nonomuraea angiospora]|uniref:Zn-ribbon domain-containing OB-fold protein n=1 Tax=Nonomuraea angiospora TaxID=46172 RepID=UPI0029A646B2|nr:Zn-ribbon domain-containing OB-fold protein [Nonomuraea angiospora]MDX3103776.1 Zn-ribbon domain-containing OB-fold protein [Nonomuraea angiospora]